MDGEQTGHPGALLVGAANQMPRSLGGDHRHVDVLRGDDLAEVDVESMGEEEGVSRVEVGLDGLGVDDTHHLVRHQHHDRVRPLGGLVRAEDLQPGCLRLCPARRAFAKAHHYVDSRLHEIEGMGVALAPVSDDGDLLGLDEPEVAVRVVVDRCHAPIVVGLALGGNLGS